MHTFKSFLSEEVVPAAYVHNGVIDLQKDEVRDNINIILKSLGSQMYVTPYSGLHHISKALAQFHIILPKRTFMEGSKGIEVYEMRQFGNVIGMNNDGEFINDVPVKHYLFLRYQMIGLGMFQVFAKCVEKGELDSLINQTELSLAEDNLEEWKTKRRHKPEIPDSDDAPFEGGHKASSENPMSHAHRLALKAKARFEKKKVEESFPIPGEEDENRKKKKNPFQQSMDQKVRRVRMRIGKKNRHRE
jgi:hypothetical protein